MVTWSMIRIVILIEIFFHSNLHLKIMANSYQERGKPFTMYTFDGTYNKHGKKGFHDRTTRVKKLQFFLSENAFFISLQIATKETYIDAILSSHLTAFFGKLTKFSVFKCFLMNWQKKQVFWCANFLTGSQLFMVLQYFLSKCLTPL